MLTHIGVWVKNKINIILTCCPKKSNTLVLNFEICVISISIGKLTAKMIYVNGSNHLL